MDAKVVSTETLTELLAAATDLLNSTDFQVEDTSHVDPTTLEAASRLAAAISEMEKEF